MPAPVVPALPAVATGTCARRRPARVPARRRVAVAALGLALAACAPPELSTPAPSATPTGSGGPGVAATDDDDVDALAADVALLRTTVADARAALEATAAGEARLDEVVALLVATPSSVTDAATDGAADPTGATAPAADGPDDAQDDAQGDAPAGTDPTAPPDAAATPVGSGDGPGPVLPGAGTSREQTIAYGDLLTRLRTAGREAGGAGEQVLRLLADPLAGDLGAWQRAPADQLDVVARAAAASDLDAAGTAILADVEGEVPRALAWSAYGLRNPDDAAAAASRALAHLTVVEVALDDLDL